MKLDLAPVALLLLFNVGASHFVQQPNFFRNFLGSITEHPEGLPSKHVTAFEERHEPHGHEEGHPEHGHHEQAEHGHHEEAEHGHHEGAEHGHGEHEAAEPGSFSLACFLMGGVGVLMFLFYLVNSPLQGVKAATWRVLNMTASIFVAVLIYGTIKMLILHIFEPGFKATIGLILTLFILLYVGTHAILFKLKGGDKLRIQAAGTVLGHMTGFAAMYGFADCREVEMFEELDTTGIILLIVGAALLILTLSFVMDKVMKKLALGDGVIDEDEERWIEICDETDDDVFCLAISFLCVLLFRQLIRGKTQPYEPGKVGNVTQTDANILLLVSVGFCVLAAAGAVAIVKFSSQLTANALDNRFTTNFQHLNSMILAWSFLFWAEWQLYVWGWEKTVIAGCLCVALFLTICSFAAVFAINQIEEHFQDKMAKRALNSLELALGVLVGFSWERAFDVGFEEIEHNLEHGAETSSVPGTVWVVLLSIVLFCFVAPAWRLYILPKTMALEEKEILEEN